MKFTKTQLKQIIKEELEVILTNEEAGELFGEELEQKLDEVDAESKRLDETAPLNEDGHSDVPSACRKLKTSIEDAAEMLKTLEAMDQDADLPSWWMSKITLAANYLNKTRDYLLY